MITATYRHIKLARKKNSGSGSHSETLQQAGQTLDFFQTWEALSSKGRMSSLQHPEMLAGHERMWPQVTPQQPLLPAWHHGLAGGV